MNLYSITYQIPSRLLPLVFQCEANNAAEALGKLYAADVSALADVIELKKVLPGENFADMASIQDRNYRRARDHWLAAGYSHNTASALAMVLHGSTSEVREWAKNIMETTTNLKLADMI